MMEPTGRSLELFYIDGRPDGMLTAELFNWTGHVLVTPRTRLAEALTRDETGYAGVYILLGEKEGEGYAYIGEGEDISSRLRTHAKSPDKDWWETAVLVSAAANRLNKAHVRYLEARLIAVACEIGHTPLQNGTNPPLPVLSEADVAKMEAFLANLLVILPAVRVDMFIQRSRPAGSTASIPVVGKEEATPISSPLTPPAAKFILNYPKHGIQAHAILQNGEFIVEAGSQAYHQWQGTEGYHYRPLYEELVRGGVLVSDGATTRFAKDYAFSSPSAAATIVYGRAANGQTAWHEVTQDIPYRDWEAQLLSITEPQEI